MNHRNDMRTVMIANGAQPVAHTLIRRDVHGNVCTTEWGRYWCLPIETNNVIEVPSEPAHHSRADRTVGPCNDDDPTVGCAHRRKTVQRN